MTVTIRAGFAAADRAEVARLYWQAFGDKLGPILRPEAKALEFIGGVMRADHALAAYDGDRLLGIAGFKTPNGAFASGAPQDLRRVYGVAGAGWRLLMLNLLQRDVENLRFLMDGLVVRPDARGQGIGSALLRAICAEAAQRGYGEVRLDVADGNDRARALYERHGFRALKTVRQGVAGLVLGIARTTAMVRASGP